MGKAIDTLVERRMLDGATAERLLVEVSSGRSVIIVGRTGSGKTTLLAALLDGYGDRSLCLVESLPEIVDIRGSLAPEGPGLRMDGHGGCAASPLRPSPLVMDELRDGHFAMLWIAAAGLGRPCITTLHGSLHQALDKAVALAATDGADRDLARKALEGVLVVEVARDPDGRRVVTGLA